MPKPNKSSASSGTRKKHARKAGTTPDSSIIISQPKQKSSKGKPKKGEPPRVKQYIPPIKPSAPRPDPLDTLGLAAKLPPDLVVELRRFGKKDTTTKQKALEEIQISWVNKAHAQRISDEDEDVVGVLEQMLPVWLHHYPSFALHPSRKIRLLAVSLHSSLLTIPFLRSRILYFLNETADIAESEFILGAWCLSSFDNDRLVSYKSKSSWDEVIVWGEPPEGDEASSSRISLGVSSHFSALLGFVQKAVMDPTSLHMSFTPPAPIAIPPPISRGSAKAKQAHRTPVPSPKYMDDSLSTRAAKSEADEETEDDRRARYRICALGALKWIVDSTPSLAVVAESSEPEAEPTITPSTQLHEFLSTLSSYESFWTMFYHGPRPPFAPSTSLEQESGARLVGFGNAQPGVRRAAWTLLHSLSVKCSGLMEIQLDLVSSAVLRSAFVEHDPGVRSTMWAPLLTLLNKYPHAWIADARSYSHQNVSKEEDDDEENEDEEHTDVPVDANELNSIAFSEFLEFLRLGCAGSPVQSYPTIMVVLSTIPRQILPLSHPSLNTLFTAFWAAIDSRVLASLLERISLQAGSAFLSSLVESVILIVNKILKEAGDGEEPSELAKKIVEEQMVNVWNEICTGSNLKVDLKDAGEILAKFLTRLSDLRKDIFDVAWGIITTPRDVEVQTTLDELGLFAEMCSKMGEGSMPRVALENLILERATLAVSRLTVEKVPNDALESIVKDLTSLLVRFGGVITRDHELLNNLDSTMGNNISHLFAQLSSAALIDLVFAYLNNRNEVAQMTQVWRNLLSAIGSPNIEKKRADQALIILLNRRQEIPGGLMMKGDELRPYVQDTVQTILEGGTDWDAVGIIVRLVAYSNKFLNNQLVTDIIKRAVSSTVQSITLALYQADIPLTSLLGSLEILTPLFTSEPASPHVLEERVVTNLLPAIYVLAFVLAKVESQTEDFQKSVKLAGIVWKKWISSIVDETVKGLVKAEIESLLRDIIHNVQVRVSPSAVVQAALSSDLETSPTSVLQLVFPSRASLEEQYRQVSVPYVDTPISLFGSPERIGSSKTVEYDSNGLSSYARSIWGLLEVLTEDRLMARDNLWILPHFILVDTISSDRQNNHLHGTGDGVLSGSIQRVDLSVLAEKAQLISSYLLNAITDDLPSGWHSQITARIKKKDLQNRSLDPVVAMFEDVFFSAMESEGLRDLRVLKCVLSKLLKNASAEESEHWVFLSQSLLEKTPQTSLAISLSVTSFGLESTKLDRYRNELASRLSGVPPKRANHEGLKLLRHLISTAPHPESEAVFLPQQRAVFLIQGLQKWIASDEDLDEEIDGLLAALFGHLAPIVQSVPGSHWELIFDLMDSNLENSTLSDESTLSMLLHTLQLIIKVEELASSNKGLRETWSERKTQVLELVGQRFMERVDGSIRSVSRDECRELLMSVARDLPVPIGEQDGIPALCQLLKDPSLEIQKAAHHLLTQVVAKRTERIVIEAAVATEESDKQVEIPTEVLELLQVDLFSDEENEEVPDERLAAYLFAWMIAFDMFKDASLKVRNDYIEQLRNLDIIPSHFLPNIFGILSIGTGGTKPFKVDHWVVDEFHIFMMDDSFSDRFKVLAAHLLYRSLLTVPSLIRTWYLECRDRQLSGAIATYTIQSFTPVLISHELSSLKDPVAMEELQDENFTVKISQSINEVTCTYIVDEQPIEIRIKFPQEYPLKPIEVRDVNKVVISETKWRSWLFGVQQVSQSGRILDAVTLFKRNVTLHFEGLQECAICYSIISVMDQSLPKKPCKTCHNRFHAGCLYKWFQTSTSSTCPLCRSQIL